MGVLALDDRDPSITYSPGWAQAGIDREYNSTTTWTSVAGATAKVAFYGSAISIYGTIAATSITNIVAPVSTYTLDANPPVRFEGSLAVAVQYNQLFFRSPKLEDSQHTLTITNLAADAQLFLDLLVVTPPESPLVTTVTTTMAPSIIRSAYTVTVTSTVEPSGTAVGSSLEPSSEKGNTAAIAGGVIGAIIFLLLLGFGVVFYRKRRKSAQDNVDTFWTPPKSIVDGNGTPSALPPTPQPHPYGQTSMSQPTTGLYPYQSEYQSRRQFAGGYPNLSDPAVVPQQSELVYYSATNDASQYAPSPYTQQTGRYAPPSQATASAIATQNHRFQ